MHQHVCSGRQIGLNSMVNDSMTGLMYFGTICPGGVRRQTKWAAANLSPDMVVVCMCVHCSI